MSEHGVRPRFEPVPRWARALILSLLLVLAAVVAYDRIEQRHGDRLLAACQDNYDRFHGLGEQARAALADGERDEAEKVLRAVVAELRKHSVCYEDDFSQGVLQRVQEGLRTGRLVAPPEPRYSA
jgi:hypothetical protein